MSKGYGYSKYRKPIPLAKVKNGDLSGLRLGILLISKLEFLDRF